MFTLSIETKNAAFNEERRPHEVARILRALAHRIDSGDGDGILKDINGNSVGEYSFNGVI